MSRPAASRVRPSGSTLAHQGPRRPGPARLSLSSTMSVSSPSPPGSSPPPRQVHTLAHNLRGSSRLPTRTGSQDPCRSTTRCRAGAAPPARRPPTPRRSAAPDTPRSRRPRGCGTGALAAGATAGTRPPRPARLRPRRAAPCRPDPQGGSPRACSLPPPRSGSARSGAAAPPGTLRPVPRSAPEGALPRRTFTRRATAGRAPIPRRPGGTRACPARSARPPSPPKGAGRLLPSGPSSCPR
jgi:hypothetical protein